MAYTIVPLAEGAQSLGLAASTLRHQIRLGKLTATKMGRDWWVTHEELERYRKVSKR